MARDSTPWTEYEIAISPRRLRCSGCGPAAAHDVPRDRCTHLFVLAGRPNRPTPPPQELWLRAELAANTRKCTLAYWHRPRFSSTGTNNLAAVKPLWDALYAYNADVVVNANYTVYERFAPQSPTAVSDSLGIREFIVGTGGLNLQNPGGARPNSQVRNGTTYGVLKFVLDTASYAWEFVPVAGG